MFFFFSSSIGPEIPAEVFGLSADEQEMKPHAGPAPEQTLDPSWPATTVLLSVRPITSFPLKSSDHFKSSVYLKYGGKKMSVEYLIKSFNFDIKRQYIDQLCFHGIPLTKMTFERRILNRLGVIYLRTGGVFNGRCP